MRYLLIALAVVGSATLALSATASGGGRSPAQLQRAGWDCLNPGSCLPGKPERPLFPARPTGGSGRGDGRERTARQRSQLRT